MVDLGVELHAVDSARLVADTDRGAGGGAGAEGKAFRDLCHIVAVAHPRDAAFLQAMENFAGGIKEGFGFAVFARGIVLCGSDLAAQMVGDQLTAVADAENRQPEGEDLRVDLGRTFGVDALRTAGEDEADGVVFHQLAKRRGAGLDLAVYVCLAHAACDELVILPAKIQNQYYL